MSKITQKVTLEQGAQDEYKRMILEKGEELSNSPRWDGATSSFKEGMVHHGNIFANSFIASLLPSAIICLAVFGGLALYLYSKFGK